MQMNKETEKQFWKEIIAKKRSIGNALLDYLYAHGLEHIFGIPGDYVLQMDKLIEMHQINFINATRENTAGYMADAYARLKGLGAVCITYGVGINITNAISQAYVESSPVVIISGAPGMEEYSKGQKLHHLFNKRHLPGVREHIQLDIFKKITVDQVVLDDPMTACELIERAIDNCLTQQKPVYIELPRNAIHLPVTAASRHYKITEICESRFTGCFQEIQKYLNQCERPVIWAGHEIQRYGMADELLNFAEKYQIPIVSSLLGKTVISENHPLFAGVYFGGMSRPEVQEFVENSDCLLQLGVLLTDIDTGIFTAKMQQEIKIRVTSEEVVVGKHRYEKLPFIPFMQHLVELDLDKPYKHTVPKQLRKVDFKATPKAKITTARTFECLDDNLGPDNIVITDIGDCLFGGADLTLEQNSFLACAYFATLGFGVPGAVAAQLACPSRRVIAIIGDGAFQISCTELSAALRYDLDPIIIVLNNHGYGTERPLLEGSYNDIQEWNYSALPDFLGGGVGIKTETEEEFESALTNALQERGQFRLIEVPLDKLDFSPALVRFTNLVNKNYKH